MTIVINKLNEKKFIAHVADPKTTFMSGIHPDVFEPFRDGIIADGNTWGEVLENIKKQINKYLGAHQSATGELPAFAKEEQVLIISENTTLGDLME